MAKAPTWTVRIDIPALDRIADWLTGLDQAELDKRVATLVQANERLRTTNQRLLASITKEMNTK